MATRRPTVYYNSACPVCDAGVCSMREKVPADSVRWVDVHTQSEELAPLGLDLEDVRKRFHLVGADGQVIKGWDALASTWRFMPGWGWIGAPLRWRPIRAVGNFVYDRFASVLYRWNRRRGNW